MPKLRAVWSVVLLLLITLTSTQFVAARPLTSPPSAPPAQRPPPAPICAFPSASLNRVYLPAINRGGEPTAANPPAPLEAALRYQVGQTYRYSYELSNATIFGSIDRNGVQSEDPSTILTYGQARISIIGQENSDTFIGALVLDDAVLCTQNPLGPDQFADEPELLATWQTPLRFTQHRDGRILDVQLAASADPVAAEFMKAILNSLQVTLRAEANYTAIEQGSQGRYGVAYQNELRDNGLYLSKRITDADFSLLYSQGDRPAIGIDNRVSLVLERQRGVISEVRFYEFMDILGSLAAYQDTSFDGNAVWGHSTSTGHLKLIGQAATPVGFAAALAQQEYRSVGMEAVFDELPPTNYGLDLATLDINAELDAYERVPATNPDPSAFERMRRILEVDSRNPTGRPVLNAVLSRLNLHRNNPSLAQRYLSLLSYDGSALAQSALLSLLDPNQAVADALRDLALIELGQLNNPTSSTVTAIAQISQDTSRPALQRTRATMALGSFAAQLDQGDDPRAAEVIIGGLRTRLENASDNDERAMLLYSLGNTNSPNVLSLITPFLPENAPNAAEQVQWAALIALGSIPGPQAEALLIKAVENDDGLVKPVPQQGAALALKNRPGKPSDAANKALKGYYGDPPQPKGGVFAFNWDRELGSRKVKGFLPGSAVWKSPPFSSRLEASVTQSLDYQLNLPRFDYEAKGVIIGASAMLIPNPQNPDAMLIDHNLILFDKNIGGYKRSVACAGNFSDSLFETPPTGKLLFERDFKVPVYWGLKVGTRLAGTVYFKVSYASSFSLCNPANMSAKFDVLLTGKFHFSASGYGQALVVRGGLELAVDVVDVTLPPKLTATYTPQNDFEACGEFYLTFRPLRLRFFLYADRWRLRDFDWYREYNHSLWDSKDDLPGNEFYLLNKCWKP